jgi:hypothetical protein
VQIGNNKPTAGQFSGMNGICGKVARFSPARIALSAAENRLPKRANHKSTHPQAIMKLHGAWMCIESALSSHPYP